MLPQRRKTAEEIAKLRESLGIPGEMETEPEDVGTETDTSTDAPSDEPAATEPPSGVSENAKAKAKEKTSIDTPLPADVSESVNAPVPARRVRSLRKSEQKPAEFSPVETKHGIPIRRHDERELMEIRRIQAAPPDKAIAYIQHLAAPWPLVVLGYLFPLVGAACGLFAALSPKIPEPDFPSQWLIDLSRAPWLGKAGFAVLAACCAIGLLFAAWFAWKKPRSRHHAGFIVILAVPIAVFGIIHQFDPTHGP